MPSAFTDATEIFDAPSDVFERHKLEPAFGLPLIILVLGIGILFFPSRGGVRSSTRSSSVGLPKR